MYRYIQFFFKGEGTFDIYFYLISYKKTTLTQFSVEDKILNLTYRFSIKKIKTSTGTCRFMLNQVFDNTSIYIIYMKCKICKFWNLFS